MYALVVSLNVNPDKRDQFLAAAEDDSICSVRDEPGCLRFDVLEDHADPNHFYFYEVYEDADAFKAHATFPHFLRWRAAAADVLANPTQPAHAKTLFPREYR